MKVITHFENIVHSAEKYSCATVCAVGLEAHTGLLLLNDMTLAEQPKQIPVIKIDSLL